MNAAATTEWVINKPLIENRCRKSQKNISRENAQQKSDKTHSTREEKRENVQLKFHKTHSTREKITEKGRLAASLSGFRSFEINVKNVVGMMKMFCQVNCS